MEPLKSFEGPYDIPIEDLKRYRKLPPEEIFRWLEEINDLTRQAQSRHSAGEPKRPYPEKNT